MRPIDEIAGLIRPGLKNPAIDPARKLPALVKAPAPVVTVLPAPKTSWQHVVERDEFDRIVLIISTPIGDGS